MTTLQVSLGLSVADVSPTADETVTVISFDPQTSTPGDSSSVPCVSFNVAGDYAAAGSGTATTGTLTVLGEAIDVSQSASGLAYTFVGSGHAYLHTDGYWRGSVVFTITYSSGVIYTKVYPIVTNAAPPLTVTLYSTSSSPVVSGANITRLT
jgi:hypothetical protein